MFYQNGFSLIELLSVIALITIGMMFAAPSYQLFIQKYQSIAVTNHIVNAIAFAKASAIRYHETVTLCPSKSGKSCDDDFTQGMIIFIDKNSKGVQPIADNLLRVYHKIYSGQIVWNRKEKYLQFAKTGFLRSQNGIFFYFPIDKMKTHSQEIIVSKTGRVRVVLN